jgi:hypothetical protein
MTTSIEPTNASVNDFLAEPLRVGEPDIAGPLAVFPIFGPEPRAGYQSFAQARKHGVHLGELEGGASVNDLAIENPTPTPVLLFDGEEVLGAQQNRTFDISVLVAANSKVRVPVSCVEAGRWDGSRHRESFAPSPQSANPRMRRLKALQVSERVAVGAAARANQSEVWQEVDATVERHGAHSPTRAMHDVYESRRGRLHEVLDAIRFHDGQVGAIAAINGELWVFDCVSRPDVFASLHGPLVQGYALDALEREGDTAVVPGPETASGFALLTGDCALARRRPSIGLGENAWFTANGVTGSALVHDGELIQLTAFPGDEPEQANPGRPIGAGRIRRPSRRR